MSIIVTPVDLALDVWNGATYVGTKTVDGGRAIASAVSSTAHGAAAVAGAADATANLVPGGWASVVVLATIAVFWMMAKAVLPAARAASVEAAAVYVDTQAPGQGAAVRSMDRSKGRRATAARTVTASRARGTEWGSGTQGHIAAPGKAPIIDRADDRQGRPTHLLVCAETPEAADRRIRRSTTAGFRAVATGACPDYPGRVHRAYIPAHAAQTATTRRRGAGGPR